MRKEFPRLVLATGLVFLFATTASAKRLIPNDNLAYPVLVTLKSGGRTISSGSGIYVNTADAVYLVTARHVIAPGLPNPQTKQIEYGDLMIELLSYSKDFPLGQRNIFALDFRALQDNGFVRPSNSRDVAAIKIGTLVGLGGVDSTLVLVPGVTQLQSSSSGLLGASLETIRTFDQVLVGNDAILYGYPASLGLPNTHQFDPLRPLLRKALIAGQDPEKRTLIIDGPVYRGNSGGPVFEVDVEFPNVHYYLVGILTEFIPLTESAPDFMMLLNSGYSVAEPMDFVLDLLH